ncbi:uncharacterized protein [Amphiura filiformis]|uniref:uncharacterized protein n=1 Tax=Amphiura filiformis TaxID=82378 RepID=UPI003B22390D
MNMTTNRLEYLFRVISLVSIFAFLCPCYHGYDYPFGVLPCKYVNETEYDCSHRGLLDIPPLPPNLYIIDLFENAITYIPEDTFLEQIFVKYLWLDTNRLTNLTGSPFRDLSMLVWLDFSHNILHDIGKDLFDGLINLNKLYLSFNKLHSFPEGCFNSLDSLCELHLDNNEFTRIPSGVFSALRNLNSVDFDFNYFDTLELTDEFHSLTSLSSFRISIDASYSIIRNNTFKELSNIPLTSLAFAIRGTVFPEPGLFEPLKNLTELSTSGTLYQSLESLTSPLQVLSLEVGVNIVPPQILSNESLARISHLNASLANFTLNLFVLASVEDYAFSNLFNLREIDLSYNYLKYISVYAFVGLYKLQSLVLKHNYLSSVPFKAFYIFNSYQHMHVIDISENRQLAAYDLDDHNPPFNLGKTDILYAKNNSMSIFMFEWTYILLNVTELYWDGNNFVDFSYCDTLLPSLKIFSTSGTLINTNGALFATLMPNLETGLFSHSFIEVQALSNSSRLTKLDLSNSRIESDEFNSAWPTIYLSKLQTLHLSSNKLTSLQDNTFQTTPMIQVLDLSFNQISAIHLKTFANTKFLTDLNLQNNRLTSMAFIKNSGGFTSLNMAQNKLSEVTKEFLDNFGVFNKSVVALLDLSGNPFVCNCKVLDFREWLLSDTRTLIVMYMAYPSMYQCASPNSTKGRSITDVKLDCASHIVLYVSTVLGSSTFIAILAFLCRRYRWKIRYRWFMLWRYRRYRHYLDNGEDDINIGDDEEVRYDAYVSYCEDNCRDERWVANNLRINLENDADNPLNLCIKARDLIPGDCKCDAIAENISRSRRTIAVLSESFVDDEWCYFEMQMALTQLFDAGRDVLILIRLEDFPEDKLTMSLRQLLCTKECLDWPDDQRGQGLFWHQLRDLIKQPVYVDRRFVA